MCGFDGGVIKVGSIPRRSGDYHTIYGVAKVAACEKRGPICCFRRCDLYVIVLVITEGSRNRRRRRRGIDTSGSTGHLYEYVECCNSISLP